MESPMSSAHFRFWAREQFSTYRGSVGYIESLGDSGEPQRGTCFHVGEGVFVTARHVVENRTITEVGFDDNTVTQELLRDPKHWGQQRHGRVNIIAGPFFHPNPDCDVACFRIEPYPKVWIPLGGHLDDYLGQYELVLYRTLVLGYPPIPLVAKPTLVASLGEVNALVDLYVGSKHPHFIISTMARGGFSGAPALVAYNEENTNGGTAVLGLVTQALTTKDQTPEQGYLAVLTVEPIYTCLEQNNMLPKDQRYE
jgi:hypothetical protein